MSGHPEADIYHRQGMGNSSGLGASPALVIVDFVNGFADPAHFGGGNILGAMDNTIGLLELARRRGWPVAHTRVVYADDGSDAGVFTLKAPSLRKLTEHDPLSQIVAPLLPERGELVVRKQGASAFFGTGLATWLAFRRVDTVIVAGCTTSGCVRATVVDAMQHNFRTVVVTDCVGDRALGPHEANLFDMGQKYADLLTLAELETALRGVAAAAPVPPADAAAPSAPSPAPLAEIREDEAPPEVAEIYASLRRATGVPLVNLIWRHAATLPGALAWMWDAAAPALQSGAVAQAARRMSGALPVPALPGVDPVRSGMQLADLGRILDLVEAYNRGNLTNLILLTSVRRLLEEGPAAGRAAPAGTAAPPRMLPPVPPIPRLDALPPAQAAQVRALAARHGAEAGGVVPSLYLHLALWPAALEALPHWLGAALTPEGLARGRDAAVTMAAQEAEAIRAMMPDIPPPPVATEELLPVLQRFTTEVIPAMVPVGLALRKVLAGE
ncbi:MAG TPA: isochorismatase family protein [Acetobacteraceae bacterium]|nr:isochorismatase family protein [Acetobacteraceae bacterium]